MAPDDRRPNDPTPVERMDYGVKVARANFDVNHAQENQLLFNSSWPILQIVRFIDVKHDTDYDNAPGYIPPAIDEFHPFVYSMRRYRHGLGYAPLVMNMGKDAPISYDDSDYKYYIDREYVYVRAHDWANLRAKLLVTQINLEEDADYVYTEQPRMVIGETYNADYGMLSAISGGNVEEHLSADNLAFNPRIISSILLAVKTEKTATAVSYEALHYIVYDPPTGWKDSYQPLGFISAIFIHNDETPPDYVGRLYQPAAIGGQTSVGMMTMNPATGRAAVTIKIDGFPNQIGDYGAIVALRTPMTSPDVITENV